jgi:hypothetical protein
MTIVQTVVAKPQFAGGVKSLQVRPDLSPFCRVKEGLQWW